MARKQSSSNSEALRLVVDEEQSGNVSIDADDSTRQDIATALSAAREVRAEPLELSQYRTETLAALLRIADALDRLAPLPSEKVDARYVANRLGCTTEWVAQQARDGRIPTHCIVRGTGNGKPWKFYRGKIEKWIDDR